MTADTHAMVEADKSAAASQRPTFSQDGSRDTHAERSTDATNRFTDTTNAAAA